MRGTVGFLLFLIYMLSCLAGNAQDDDAIGLSKHALRMRGMIDTLTVTARHCGWTIDSVSVFEKQFGYRKPFRHSVYYTSRRERRRIARGKPFEGTFGWLIVRTEAKGLTFSSTIPQEPRTATVYLHKGDFVDTVWLSQPPMPIGYPSVYYVDPIDLYPNSRVFPADGGSIEATTRGTTWWIDEIVIIGDDTTEAKVFCPSQKEKEDRVARQACRTALEWITVENEGKDVKITVGPNTTGECREFEIILKCNYMSGGKTKVDTDTFYGSQDSESEKCLIGNIDP